VAKPHNDLGRPGTVCPVVPRGLEAKTLWLVPEHAAGASVPDLVQIAEGCKRQFLSTEPTDGSALNRASRLRRVASAWTVAIAESLRCQVGPRRVRGR